MYEHVVASPSDVATSARRQYPMQSASPAKRSATTAASTHARGARRTSIVAVCGDTALIRRVMRRFWTRKEAVVPDAERPTPVSRDGVLITATSPAGSEVCCAAGATRPSDSRPMIRQSCGRLPTSSSAIKRWLLHDGRRWTSRCLVALLGALREARSTQRGGGANAISLRIG